MAVIEFIDQIEKEEGRGKKKKKKNWTHCYLTVRSSNSTNPKKSAHVVRPGKCRLILTSATLS